MQAAAPATHTHRYTQTLTPAAERALTYLSAICTNALLTHISGDGGGVERFACALRVYFTVVRAKVRRLLTRVRAKHAIKSSYL